MYKNINKVSGPVKKFCKVCQDAGKTEDEYRSHFTRESPDPKSKVTCPTLLAQSCRYCFKNGHTVKYCAVLKDNEKKQKRGEIGFQNSDRDKKAELKPKGKLNNKNVFMYLDSDSEEEDELVKEQVAEEFPALITPVCRIQLSSTNYASVAAKPAAPNPKPQVVEVLKAPEVLKTPAPWAIEMPTNYKSWAAFDSDSEEEEEDFEEEYNDAW